MNDVPKRASTSRKAPIVEPMTDEQLSSLRHSIASMAGNLSPPGRTILRLVGRLDAARELAIRECIEALRTCDGEIGGQDNYIRCLKELLPDASSEPATAPVKVPEKRNPFALFIEARDKAVLWLLEDHLDLGQIARILSIDVARVEGVICDAEEAKQDQVGVFGIWCVNDRAWCGGATYLRGTKAAMLALLPEWKSGSASDLKRGVALLGYEYEVRRVPPCKSCGGSGWRPSAMLPTKVDILHPHGRCTCGNTGRDDCEFCSAMCKPCGGEGY